MTFNAFDVLLLMLVGVGSYLGYRAGPLKKTVTLVATVVAIGVGIRLMNPVGGALARWGVLPPATAFVLVFTLFVILLLASTYLLYRRFGKKTSARTGGRIASAVLGMVEAVLLLSVFLLMIKLLDYPSERIRSGSLLYRPVVNFAPWSFDALRTILPGGGEVEEGVTGQPSRSP